MKQLVIAWTTELNCGIVSDLDASAGLGRPYERRGGSYAGCDGAHCCGVVGCLFGLVGLLEARDSMRLMMLEDGLMFGCRGRRKREKGRKTAGPNDISLVTPRNALQARVTLA